MSWRHNENVGKVSFGWWVREICLLSELRGRCTKHRSRIVKGEFFRAVWIDKAETNLWKINEIISLLCCIFYAFLNQERKWSISFLLLLSQDTKDWSINLLFNFNLEKHLKYGVKQMRVCAKKENCYFKEFLLCWKHISMLYFQLKKIKQEMTYLHSLGIHHVHWLRDLRVISVEANGGEETRKLVQHRSKRMKKSCTWRQFLFFRSKWWKMSNQPTNKNFHYTFI